MQDNKKTIADEMFEPANIINKASTTANLYGKLFALQEMQIYVLSEIKKVKEQIERKDIKWVEYEWIPNLEIRF